MPVLHRDFETQSAASLKRVGACRYAADPSTRVLVIAYAVDDGPVESFIPESGVAPPAVFFEAANNPDWRVCAHNDAFESAIEEYVLGPDFPQVPIERHLCTLATARYCGLPGELGKVATLLELLVQKDREGARVMLEVCRPRKARRGEDKAQTYWPDITPEKIARLIAYCKNDVVVEREIFNRLPRLPDYEHRVLMLDRKINIRGFRVDIDLAHAAQKLVQEEKASINAQIHMLTAGAVEGFTKLNDMREFVNAHGHSMAKVNKRAIKAVLAHDPDAAVRELLELRQASNNTAVEKYNAVLAGVFPDQRIRGLLIYHGTHTGRWTSAGFNAHNLPREDPNDALAAIAAIKSGDLEQVRAFGPPLSVIARLARGLVIASPGKLLLAGDFTTIEPRVASWFAAEMWKLETFHKFDETGDPMLDTHRVVGARMRGKPVDPHDDEARQHGKIVHMAFNYGASVRVWREHVPNDPRTDPEIKTQEVDKFRQMHPAQTTFMYNLDRDALHCVRHRRTLRRKRHSFEMDGDTLILRLPSGRLLFYPRAHIVPGKFGKDVVAYHNPAKNREDEMWYGSWLAHLVSATSRDLLVSALHNLDAAGFDIILHVHDEIVAEVDPADVEHSRERFKACMTQTPAWAAGLPFAAKVRAGPRYVKTDAPIENVEPAPIEIAVAEQAHLEGETESAPTSTPYVNGFATHHAESEIYVASLKDIVTEPMIRDKVLCPFHNDTNPSCHIYDDHYFCFVCEEHGDIIDWLMKVEELSFHEAQETIASCIPRVRPAAEDVQKTLIQAKRLWDAAGPIAGTLAADYLAFREIDVEQLTSSADAVLRFHPRCPFGPDYFPCLLALYRDIDTDEFAGIHRIALTPSAFTHVAGSVQRQSLGRWAPRRRAVKLWPAKKWLVLGEGLETTLASATRITHGGHPLRPAWAMLSARAIERCGPIPGVECVVLLADNEPVGIRAAETAAEALSTAGTKAVLLTPQAVKDFNDLVIARARP